MGSSVPRVFLVPWCRYFCFLPETFDLLAGPRVDNFQSLDPRKQELLEARFLGMRSSSNPAGGATNNLTSSSSNLMVNSKIQPR